MNNLTNRFDALWKFEDLWVEICLVETKDGYHLLLLASRLLLLASPGFFVQKGQQLKASDIAAAHS